jgi:hypothetical protein
MDSISKAECSYSGGGAIDRLENPSKPSFRSWHGFSFINIAREPKNHAALSALQRGKVSQSLGGGREYNGRVILTVSRREAPGGHKFSGCVRREPVQIAVENHSQ